ncbi:hypothetical protein V8B97DRAFT_2024338 [Scleroderma yunnanense]
MKQMTRHDHWDLQHTIIATIAGIAEQDFVHTIHTLINFIYQAQSPMFTESSIHNMEGSLSEFHKYKGAILQAGEIDHFQIPKLKLLQSFSHAICNVGSLIQYMVDVSKCLLIMHCKDPFSHTNHQHAEFMQQIVLLLDHEESIQQFNLYALLHKKRLSLMNTLPVEYNGLLSDNAMVAFHMTIKSNFADKLSNYVATMYHLSNFTTLLWAYIVTICGNSSHFNGCLLKGWLNQQVQALPPSSNHAYGKCDAVLIQSTPHSEQPGVAQVQAIFALSPRGSPLPVKLSVPLLYVQHFAFMATPADQPNVGMYTVRHLFLSNPDGSPSQVGSIISMLDVLHAIELIPKYRASARCDVESETSLELYDEFFLNNFSDKEWYYTTQHSDDM